MEFDHQRHFKRSRSFKGLIPSEEFNSSFYQHYLQQATAWELENDVITQDTIYAIARLNSPELARHLHAMSQSDRNAVLIELTRNRAIAKNRLTYRWLNRRKGLLSLRNEITSALFRADYVQNKETDQGLEMTLSLTGAVVAERLLRS